MKYNLISLRKYDKTKWSKATFVKIDMNDEGNECYFAKKSWKHFDESIDKINKGKYKFYFNGYIDDK